MHLNELLAIAKSLNWYCCTSTHTSCYNRLSSPPFRSQPLLAFTCSCYLGQPLRRWPPQIYILHSQSLMFGVGWSVGGQLALRCRCHYSMRWNAAAVAELFPTFFVRSYLAVEVLLLRRRLDGGLLETRVKYRRTESSSSMEPCKYTMCLGAYASAAVQPWEGSE